LSAVDLASRVQVWLVRHGETDWSRQGRHTSRTDLDLTEDGRLEAGRLTDCLGDTRFDRVRTSPARRAVETARLAGFGEVAEASDDLREWEYGEYEGLTTTEIRARVPGWTIWSAGAPGGEAPEAVGQRADRIVSEALEATGPTLLVAHAHILRVVTARWLGLAPGEGRLFTLGTGTVSVLGWEREQRVIVRWNERCAPAAAGSASSAGAAARSGRGHRTTSTEHGAP
jgi:probable phosphoglycerate mutase